MARNILPLLGLLLLAGGLVAASIEVVPAPTPPRTGFFEDDLKEPVTNKTIIHYALSSPANLPSDRELAMIFVFHGKGNPCAPHAHQWADAVKRAGWGDKYVVAAPHAAADGWENADDEPVTKFIDWALKTYPIDLRRVYLVGFSSGGWYINRYGPMHQDRFASISAYGAGVGGSPPAIAKGEPGMPVYEVIGTEDPYHDRGVAARNTFKALGYQTIFHEVTGMGHQVGNDAVIADDVRWMHQLRHGKIALSKDQEDFIRQAKSVAKAEALWTAADSAARLVEIGGLYAQAVAKQVAQSKSDEVRLAVAKASQLGWFGTENLALMIHYLDDKADDVRVAAITAIANAANWNYPDAKVALVKFAADKKNKLSERQQAVAALGAAAALITISTNYDDTLVMPGLVNLLECPEEAVRGDVFAILGKANKVGYGYEPAGAAPDRAKAVLQWKEWVQAKCGFYKDGGATTKKP